MSRELPEWQPYDFASSSLPDIRGPGDAASGGAVVVLLATPGAREDGWSARAAASMAAAMAGAGRRVFLADLDLGGPELHDVLGVANGEGVSDAFVYGASIQHVARPVEGGRYFFASAGTALGDPSAVASSARWEPILEGFRTARADVLMLVPSDQDGAATLLERATDVVLLGPPSEARAAADDGVSERVRAVFGSPEGAVPAPPDAADPDLADAGAAVGMAGDPRMEDVPRAPLGPAEGRPRGTRAGTLALVVLLLVLLAAVAAAWWMGALALPGLPSPEGVGAVTGMGPSVPSSAELAAHAAVAATAGTPRLA